MVGTELASASRDCQAGLTDGSNEEVISRPKKVQCINNFAVSSGRFPNEPIKCDRSSYLLLLRRQKSLDELE